MVGGTVQSITPSKCNLYPDFYNNHFLCFFTVSSIKTLEFSLSNFLKLEMSLSLFESANFLSTLFSPLQFICEEPGLCGLPSVPESAPCCLLAHGAAWRLLLSSEFPKNGQLNPETWTDLGLIPLASGVADQLSWSTGDIQQISSIHSIHFNECWPMYTVHSITCGYPAPQYIAVVQLQSCV